MAMQGTSDPNGHETVPTQLRRGDTATGTDGRLGTVEQIVVNQDTGEQRGIVIRRSSDGAEVEVSVEQVARLVPGELHLKLARADLDSRPDLARPYDPDQYVPVYPGETPPQADATRTAQDTGHPVVTSVEENAAQLLVPHDVAATHRAVDAPTTPRVQTQQPPTATAMPVVGGTEPSRVRSSGDGGDTGDTTPRHMGPGEAREQMRGELTEGPATEPSPIESTTGDLIGGRPTSGGVGATSTPTSESTPPQDTAGTERDAATFGAPDQRAPARAETAGASSANVPSYLAGLSDDELSNPDAALATHPQPRTAAAIELPFQADVVAGTPAPLKRPGGGSFPSDQQGMADVFSKATNTAADDTWGVDREPDALTETDRLPAGESGPRYDREGIPMAAGGAGSEAWRPNEVRGESGGVPVAAPTNQAAYNQPVRVTPQPALHANAPSQASEEAEGMPALIALAAAGLGAAVLLGGLVAGAVAAARRRRRDSVRQYKAKKAARATSEGIAATAATALAKAQEFTGGVLKPAGRRAADQAAATTERARRQVKASASEAKARVKNGAAQAEEGAKDAQKQVRKSAKRAARRGRWFRRGLVLGAAAAVLFAPAPGEELRSQLASRV